MSSIVNSRDFALLQEELKCLRTKLASTLNTTGGYTGVITSPGSSVFPNDYFTDCDCTSVSTDHHDPTAVNCSVDDSNDRVGLGDLANDFQNNAFEGLFVFDAINGVFYLPPQTNNYENRNTGLSDVTLEHGCKDVWWYKKMTPSEDNVIIWQVGDARILRSDNAGRSGWFAKTPDAPTGYSLSNIRFVQIVSDPFRQNTFLVLAEEIVQKKTFLLKTPDDGTTWTWVDLTDYNSVSERKPIWMTVNGNGGSLVWITTWGDNKIRLLKVNNDPTPTISAEYDMGDATEWDTDNYFEVLSPVSQVDTNFVWLFGRASNPQGLGLTHILRIEDDGLNFFAVEQSWGDDWCGSLQVSLASGSDHILTSVRNYR